MFMFLGFLMVFQGICGFFMVFYCLQGLGFTSIRISYCILGYFRVLYGFLVVLVMRVQVFQGLRIRVQVFQGFLLYHRVFQGFLGVFSVFMVQGLGSLGFLIVFQGIFGFFRVFQCFQSLGFRFFRVSLLSFYCLLVSFRVFYGLLGFRVKIDVQID